MTKQKDLKKKIRARTAKTGESYTEARRHLLSEKPTDPVFCSKCGQTDVGQQGEYPCSECALPTTWDKEYPGGVRVGNSRPLVEVRGFANPVPSDAAEAIEKLRVKARAEIRAEMPATSTVLGADAAGAAGPQRILDSATFELVEMERLPCGHSVRKSVELPQDLRVLWGQPGVDAFERLFAEERRKHLDGQCAAATGTLKLVPRYDETAKRMTLVIANSDGRQLWPETGTFTAVPEIDYPVGKEGFNDPAMQVSTWAHGSDSNKWDYMRPGMERLPCGHVVLDPDSPTAQAVVKSFRTLYGIDGHDKLHEANVAERQRHLSGACLKPDSDTVSREPGCTCHWEVGDSPCKVHDSEAPVDFNALQYLRFNPSGGDDKNLFNRGFERMPCGHLVLDPDSEQAKNVVEDLKAFHGVEGEKELRAVNDFERQRHLSGECLKNPEPKVLAILNGRPVGLPKVATYRDVLIAEGFDAERVLSVTYRAKNGKWKFEGILSPGQAVEVFPGMIFNVADTSNA